MALFTLAYAAFVVYGSLLPFDLRPQALSGAWLRFREIRYLELGVASRADWVANILLYIPLAFALTGVVVGHARSLAARLLGGVLAAVPCIGLAFAVEFAQLFFPPRTVSQNDLIAETIGTLIGVAAWLVAGERLLGLWHRFRAGGANAWRAVLVLYVLAYAALSFFPYDLLVSWRELAAKLSNPGLSAFVVAGSCGGVVGCSVKLVAEVAIAAPLGALLGLSFARVRIASAFALGLAVGVVIESGQLFLASGVSQGMSVLTRALGFAWGLALQRVWHVDWVSRHRDVVRTALLIGVPLYFVLLALLNGFAGQLEPPWVAADKLAATRFLPFYYHYFTTETEAMWSLLVNAGSYAPVGVAAWLLWPDRRRGWHAGLAAAALALAMESLKLFLPGKKPDPTNVLIGFAAAWVVNMVLAHLQLSATATTATPGQAPAGSAPPVRRGLVVAGSATLAALVLAGLLIASPHTEAPVDESRLPQLPPGESLPPVSLPGFRHAHPRLPHPDAADVVRLRTEGGDYLNGMRRRAERGDLYARTVMEFIEPGSQDLAAMHRQLMTIEYSWRGHNQAWPVTLAYDWLHDRWSDEQRRALRDHLATGCEYLVKVIRTERLSPYNVYLYNAPFQALVACAIALYGDDPRGEPVMRFTQDLWKHRVLPVWRQVMGTNGGWHEGGEYVGIGIGAAVYQVPAMWRAATGEDVFTEPGLRGFLDFLIHRTRPDGTHMRLGDGSYFERQVPDLVPLAIEYRHPAAYTLRAPGSIAPTALPWGPLPDATLVDSQARSRMPTARLFDGIGLVTARSDWSDTATFVTFKAGDNYWSHSHLDQGSFTIYKGGALALDSGANYGTGYGSDHHLNYSYQTIAHNAITVTDPDDTVPMPAKTGETPRYIANDGGQRRIGSGWRVEAAPLDLAEWQDKRAIYETGRIVRYADDDGVTLAVADVTAAYTNELSGKGTFSHRTRRVERAWRSFAFDRVDDVIVVYDDVVATKPEFRKRWLLHTTLEPLVDGRRFRVEIPPGSGAGRQGGRLEGHVLLPRAATLLPIGGRGLEFMVDGRNFDEAGKLLDATKPHPNRAEAGRWRLEVVPAADAAADQFLVVMLPTSYGESPPHRVRLIEAGGQVGAEVAGPMRTVRYWFRPGELGARVEVVGAAAR